MKVTQPRYIYVANSDSTIVMVRPPSHAISITGSDGSRPSRTVRAGVRIGR